MSVTDQATRIVPAGWYEDPASPAHVRWWNGLAWTEHTAQKPSAPPAQPAWQEYAQQGSAQQGSAQQGYAQHGDAQHGDAHQAAAHQSFSSTGASEVVDPAVAARIAEARELERQFGISTAEHEVIAGLAGQALRDSDASDDGAERPRYRSRRAVEVAEAEAPTATASAWFIALWPVLTFAVLAAAAYVYFYVSPQWYVLGIAAVPLLLVVLWAIADARKLRSNGHRPASPAFSLLGPFVYLVARRARVRGSGPLVVFALLTLIAVGGPVAAWMTGAAQPVERALLVQEEVSAGLIGSGRATGVSCPFFIETARPGTLYTCTATLPNGAQKAVWVSFDDSDGRFSYALSVR